MPSLAARPREARQHAPERRVEDQRRQPVLARRRPRREMPAEAPAAQRDALRIDPGQLQRRVDHGLDHRLPVRPQRDALLVERAALSRTVEEQHVIAAPRRRHGRGEIHVRDRAVIAVGQDQERPRLVRPPLGPQQVGGHREVAERDPHRRHRRLAKRQAPVEGGDLLAEGRQQPRVHRRAEDRVIGGAVEARRPQPAVARAGAPPGGLVVRRLAGEPVARRAPGVAEGLVVAVADRRPDRADLAEIGAAIGDVAQRPGPELVVQVVLEQQPHCPPCQPIWPEPSRLPILRRPRAECRRRSSDAARV